VALLLLTGGGPAGRTDGRRARRVRWAVLAPATIAGAAVPLVVLTAGIPALAAPSQAQRSLTLSSPASITTCPGDTAGILPEGGEAPAAHAATVASGAGSGPRVQVTLVTAGADAGTVALAACPSAGQSGYAFAGGTAPGESPRLVAANPGTVPTGVLVGLLTPTGRERPGVSGSLSVDAGRAAAAAVDSIATVDGVVAAEVTSSPGAVTATMRDSAVVGLATAGTSDEAPSQAGTDLVVPVVVAGERPDDAPDAPQALVALGVPGPTDGTARVTFVPVGRAGSGADGSGGSAPGQAPDPIDVPLLAGSTLAVPVPQAGEFSVHIEADVPVAAAARSVRYGAGGAADVGWAAAVTPGDLADVTLPLAPALDGTSATVTVMVTGAGAGGDSDGPREVTVDLLDTSGGVLGSRTLRIPASVTATAPVALSFAVPDDGATALRVRPPAATSQGPAGGSLTGAVGLAVLATEPPAAPRTEGSPGEGLEEVETPVPFGLGTTTLTGPAAAGPEVGFVAG
jgi:hypothetical protein